VQFYHRWLFDHVHTTVLPSSHTTRIYSLTLTYTRAHYVITFYYTHIHKTIDTHTHTTDQFPPSSPLPLRSPSPLHPPLTPLSPSPPLPSSHTHDHVFRCGGQRRHFSTVPNDRLEEALDPAVRRVVVGVRARFETRRLPRLHRLRFMCLNGQALRV
jgi:hypothetical protein